jgi:recombination protein RecA
MSDDKKKQALEAALKQIEKQFGKGSAMILGVQEAQTVESIPSGSLALDIALGIGGYPRGRIVEIYGPESAGKTTLTLHAIAAAQKAGGYVAFIDAEHALDPKYAKAVGVDLDNLILSQPDTGEQALEIAEALIRSGSIDMVVIDSVAALVPEAEINGDMGASHVGLQARMMSQAMRKLSGAISNNNVVVIFINQIREKVGIMFGNPETTPGGRALKFFSSVRLEIRRAEQLKQGTDIIGIKSNVKVVKSKVAPPLKVAAVDIMYGTGISRIGEILDIAVELELVKKSGAWFAYNDEKIGQGRENAKLHLEKHPELANELEAKIKEHYGL